MFRGPYRGNPGESHFSSMGGIGKPFTNQEVRLPPPVNLGWLQQLPQQFPPMDYGDNPFWRDLMRQFGGGGELMNGRGMY